MDIVTTIAETTRDIKNLSHQMQLAHAGIGNSRAKLEARYSNQNITSADFDPNFWRFVGVHDALSKFLEFTASNIEAMDNMVLAQHARYFCDLMMWVKHLTDPKKDAREYLEHLLRGKRLHYEKTMEHIDREIKTLRQIGKDYNLLIYKTAARAVFLRKPPPNRDELHNLTRDFHSKLDKNFSIYRTASFSHYEQFALSVEKDIVPKYASDLEIVNKQIEEFENTLGRKIAKRHESKKFAESVGMDSDYEFIYRLTSQHLHATPLSMSTEMREISKQERLVFLEYIRAKGSSILASSLFLVSGFREANQRIPGLGPNSYHCVFSRTLRRRPGASASNRASE